MAEVNETLLPLVKDELRRATDTGEGASRQQLQEACGVGSGDLDAILTHLRERGEATEQAPDEYVLTEQTMGRAAAADAGDGEEEVAEPGLSLAEAEEGGRPEPPRRGRAPAPQGDEETVRVELPLAVAKALDEAAVGGIVTAGIAEAERDGVAFVFEVRP